MTETTIPTLAATETPKPVKTPKSSKKSKVKVAKKTTKTKRPVKAKKVSKPKAKKTVKTPAKKADKPKPKVRWGSLMSIDNDELMKTIKGEKNALSAQGIAKKFKCTIWTAKRSVLRLNELSGIIVQTISRQEGKAGVPSACYFIK